MKEEYDFSKAEKGKFYRKDVKLRLPVYLEPKIFQFIEDIIKNKKKDISSVVNEIIESDMNLAKIMHG